MQNQRTEPQVILGSLHHSFTSEVLRLMDGFYSNIEDGLFELAYCTEDESQRGRCFDLMRELRFRRTNLVKTFARVMDRYQDRWFAEDAAPDNDDAHAHELERLVMRMAEKTTAHFSGVLQLIQERASQATGCEYGSIQDLPISPRHVARAFVASCRSLKLDTASIEITQQLFSRFVLDGLGSLYGFCNQRLQTEGYLTATEMSVAQRAG